jgi:transposase
LVSAEAVCVDMWEPFRLSIEEWVPGCKIVYEVHIMQRANDAIDEVRRPEFFRQGKQKREVMKHLHGILNYCRTKVHFGVVEAVNGNIRMLINRGRGYKNLRYVLLKAKRMAVTNIEFVAVQGLKQAA